MRILFLTCHLPFPPFSGGRRREYEIIRRLSRDFEVDLCCVTRNYDEDLRHLDEMRKYCSTVALFRTHEDGNISSSLNHEQIPIQVRKYECPEASSFISNAIITRSFDIVHVEGYYLMQHLGSKLQLPTLLVEQNVEYMLSQQRMKLARTKEEKHRCWSESVNTLEWERRAWKQATMCAAVTENDRYLMQNLEEDLDIRLIPDGADHVAELNSSKTIEHFVDSPSNMSMPTILFVGNFQYAPNVDAAVFFAREILPSIRAAIPNVKLFLVGNEPTLQVRELASTGQISVVGRVRSLEMFYQSADVVICPLRIGGGIKVKLLEAIHAGKAIVSTPIGVQGLTHKQQGAMLVTEDPFKFADFVITLLRDNQERIRLQELALAMANSLPTWDSVAGILSKCYKELVSNGHFGK